MGDYKDRDQKFQNNGDKCRDAEQSTKIPASLSSLQWEDDVASHLPCNIRRMIHVPVTTPARKKVEISKKEKKIKGTNRIQ
jgi:hypothetical protein